MDNKVIGNLLYIDRWVYAKPKSEPDENGKIIIILKYSFGPLEVFEWGIDRDRKPYESYKWLENDFYEDVNYIKQITNAELKEKINNMIRSAADHNLSEWIEIYEKAIETYGL